jgi:hypothetical protein
MANKRKVEIFSEVELSFEKIIMDCPKNAFEPYQGTNLLM